MSVYPLMACMHSALPYILIRSFIHCDAKLGNASTFASRYKKIARTDIVQVVSLIIIRICTRIRSQFVSKAIRMRIDTNG